MKLARKFKKVFSGSAQPPRSSGNTPAPNLSPTPQLLPHPASDAQLTVFNPQSLQGASVQPGKVFAKGQSFEKDMADLSIAYVLQENPELKKLIKLIVEIRDEDSERQLTVVLERCARFSVQLASVPESHRDEASRAMTLLHEAVLELKVQLDRDGKSIDELTETINNYIEEIKPSFIGNDKLGIGEGLSNVLDITMGPTIDILNMLKNASSLIPVPWVQPLIGTVVIMLQAVSQTRANYKEMRQIAVTAGEFVVSCAVVCSESAVGPLLKSSLKKFSTTLRGIAEECDTLRHLGLFSRYLQQSGHTGDLQGLRKKLDYAIQMFQTETSINIKLEIEEINRKIDFASLSSLPSHPRYARNEYLERSRDDVIKHVYEWVADAPEPVLWVHGAAGLGKSTFAQEFVQLLKSGDRLAGGVFLGYLTAEPPETVIQMISRQLGEMYPCTVTQIAEATRKVQGPHSSLRDYFTAYIYDPLLALNYPYPLVIVIDGLDEWQNYASFLAELVHIPSSASVKFILTSRFSHSIDRAIQKIVHHIYPLPPASQEVIEHYFHHHFSSSDINWRGQKPDNLEISCLAEQANGLLIWAATVRLLVTNKFGLGPRKTLEQILFSEEKVVDQADGTGTKLLQHLYSRALSRLFLPDIQEAHLQQFLAGILVLQEALSISQFSDLLGMSEDATEEIHKQLAALQTQGDPKTGLITPAMQQFHASFVEFITTGSDDQTFKAITATEAHNMIAQRCLEIVFTKFLPSFRGKTCKSSELYGLELYTVKFWPRHLSNSMQTQTLEVSSGGPCLDLILEEALHHWATIFLPSVTTQLVDSNTLLTGIGRSDLLYEVAMRIGKKDATTLLYHIDCLRVGIHLKPWNLRTWKALSLAYEILYRQSRSSNVLDKCINAYLYSMKQADYEDPDYLEMLNGTGSCFYIRFKEQGDQSDLDRAIVVHRKALHLHAESHSDYSRSLNNLAVCLQTRFEQQSAKSDLDEAISMHREALQLHLGSHSGRSASLNNLALCLQARFEQQKVQSDLEEAISMHREALQLRPGSHPGRSGSLNNLAACLKTHFIQQNVKSDLDEAILMHREALQLCSGSHAERSTFLNNFALCLQTCFEQDSAQSDLDEAISMHREALQFRPGSHPGRSGSLNNLAACLKICFEQLGTQSDLEDAISMHKEALQLRSRSHPGCPASLNNLACCLRTRFQQKGVQSDLEEAISMHREALELRPESHTEHSTLLSNLALSLQIRFERQGAQSDLDEAISLLQKAVYLQPSSQQEFVSLLHNLTKCLELRFDHCYLLHDLDEAISYYRQLLDFPNPQQSWSSEQLSKAIKKHEAFIANQQNGVASKTDPEGLLLA